MSVIVLVLILVFLGVVAYFVNASGKIAPFFKGLIYCVLVALAIILLLVQFGIWDALMNVKVPKVH